MVAVVARRSVMELYNPDNIVLTKYIFFTGKGGVGKTSVPVLLR